MQNRLFPRLALLSAALVATSAFAGGRAELTTFTTGLKGLDGQFNQQVFDSQGKLKETSSGRVALSAPRLFRWEYQKPYEQLIVADGRKVWVYDPDLSQVTVRAQGAQEQDTPLAALLDPTKLDKQFVVVEQPAKDGLDWLQLTPRTEGTSNFETASLGFSNGSLARMEVTDAVGQKTRIAFGAWQRNPAFAAGTFVYKAPKGVDVVGDD